MHCSVLRRLSVSLWFTSMKITSRFWKSISFSQVILFPIQIFLLRSTKIIQTSSNKEWYQNCRKITLHASLQSFCPSSLKSSLEKISDRTSRKKKDWFWSIFAIGFTKISWLAWSWKRTRPRLWCDFDFLLILLGIKDGAYLIFEKFEVNGQEINFRTK